MKDESEIRAELERLEETHAESDPSGESADVRRAMLVTLLWVLEEDISSWD